MWRALLAMPLGLGACALLVSTDGLSAADHAEQDGGGRGVDARSGDGPASPGDSGLAGGVRYDASFEDSECGQWLAKDGVITTVPNGRSGSACMLCYATPDMHMERDLPLTELGAYTLEAWVARAAGASPATAEVLIESEVPSKNPNTRESGPLGAAWSKLTVTHVAVNGLSGLVLVVGNDDALPGECMLVDDVKLTHAP